MFPDLRLLISATVATFFLAATAGLYASLRIAPDQIAARSDGRATIEDSPITRITMSWPLPEPDRAAALRELAKIATYSPAVSDEPASATDRGNVNAVPEAAKSEAETPTPAEIHSRASLNDDPAQDATGSTGIAAPSEPATLNQTDHPDIQGNIGDTAAIENAGAKKEIRPAGKKASPLVKKKTVKVQRQKKIARVPEYPVDLTNTGYPLYLTVPVTN